MSVGRKEIEAKFNLTSFKDVRRRLETLGARPTGPRFFERNLRFDSSDGALQSTHQVLRLRQSKRTILTYKRSHSAEIRTEIEFEVSDFEGARAFLLALGYQVVFSYEKYREQFGCENVQITLDELPFGRFVEVEGPGLKEIERFSASLGLDWEARLGAGYMEIFRKIRRKRSLPFRDATFENWGDLPPVAADEFDPG